MSSTWFLFVVVAVVVLVAILVTGLLIARRRRISLDAAKQVEEKPKGGSYAASGGIALAPGGVEHPVEDRPEVDGQPAVGDDAAVPRDSDQRTVRDIKLPEAEEEAPAAEEIEPAAGRMERLRGRLSKSRSMFGQSLLGLLGAGDLDEDSWQDVE
ncbi:MAG TPA: signal recognition particle-docking protein FtsY, partial [Amycolatopsis sp.]|nr:signal recognition particle-docking protein FtsY [Amycolatopsis sp.]